ncbi:acyl-CoA dehydrogenase family protein [Nocardia sp. BMG51109]|uniref:acyl-CoA dehydrogenase family protein n=1 Tax=Nocardia sp. BMG51109 TaxID=1056816 RepID=UPI0004637D69|nr:acyl-CoA dehydrogenase [Nocardia sp. BMG51109]
MDDEFGAIHEELRSVARGLLGKGDHETAVDWSQIARSGWLGLEAPAEIDGAEATFAEAAVLLEEVGRAAARSAFPAVAALGLGALAMTEPGALRDRLFREAVAGDTVPVAVLSGEWGRAPVGGGFDAERAAAPTDRGEKDFRLADEAGSLSLSGSTEFVPDALAADRLLVPARDPDGTIVLAVVDPGAEGLAVTEQPVVDATRGFGRVAAHGVAVEPDAVLRFSGDAAAALRRLHDRAAVAIACDSLGLGAAMLDATVEYVRVREQFGRQVGSFQAVKHACADMLVQVTVARRLVDAAVRAQVEHAPDAPVAASMAKAFTTDIAVQVAGKAMQLHGGIGYTWESGIHVYLKRATLNRSLFGTPAYHRARLATRYR